MTGVVDQATSRQERKLRTRTAILQASLGLVQTQSFSALSLRQVAREAGIVPTAFYRHFADMEELGLALVDESFGNLRAMLRSARRDPRTYDDVITHSIAILVQHVQRNRAHFGFIARERFGGAHAVQAAIRHQLRLVVSELALDLSRLPGMQDWEAEDLGMVSDTFVRLVVSVGEQVLEVPPDRPELLAEIIRTAERQLRLIVVGITGWEPRRSPEPHQP